jgi:hypothetical protein
MFCLWCQQPCGDQSYCGPDCYEAHEEAMEAWNRWSMANPDDVEPPQNEWCGSKGNNI